MDNAKAIVCRSKKDLSRADNTTVSICELRRILAAADLREPLRSQTNKT